MVPPGFIISEVVWPPIEQIAFAARQVEYLSEIDLQEILSNRQRASKVEAPMPAVCQDAPAQSAVRHIVYAAQITEHLRQRYTVFASLSGVGTIQGPVPT